jgi:hypothetical protein
VPLRAAAAIVGGAIEWVGARGGARGGVGISTARGVVSGGAPWPAAHSGLAAGARAAAADGARVAFVDRAGALRVFSSAGERLAACRSVGAGGGGGAPIARCCAAVRSLALGADVAATGHADGSVTITNVAPGGACAQGVLRAGGAGGGGAGSGAGDEGAGAGEPAARPRRAHASHAAAHTTVALLGEGALVAVARRPLTAAGAAAGSPALSICSTESLEEVRTLAPAPRAGVVRGAAAWPTAVRAAGAGGGALVAAGFDDGIVRLWDPRARREVAALAVAPRAADDPSVEGEDAGAAITHLCVEGHILVEARASPEGPPAPFDPRAHAAMLSSPFVRVWDLRAARAPAARVDLGYYALRAVAGLALAHDSVLVAHGHAFRPTNGAALLLGGRARAFAAGPGPALRFWGGHWRAGPAPLANPADPRGHVSLANLMTLGSFVSLAAPNGTKTICHSDIDVALVPEYAWPRGHAPCGRAVPSAQEPMPAGGAPAGGAAAGGAATP